MKNRKARTRKLFTVTANRLTAIRPDIRDEVRCPLCLGHFSRDAIDDGRISLEHPIPSALGGTHLTLTCRTCNNEHGYAFDKNLVSAMKALDALQGCGQIPVVLHSDRGHVAANITWGIATGDTNLIQIVGPASHPAGVAGIRDQIRAGTLRFKMNFDFIPEAYWRAALRAAYLAAFERLGYEYVLSKAGEMARQIITGTDEVPEILLEAYPTPEPREQAFLVPIMEKPTFLIVVLRLRMVMTRYLAVFLPLAASWEYISGICQKIGQLTITSEADNPVATTITFRADPVKILREFRIPREPSDL